MDAKLVVVGGDAKAAEIRLRLPTVIGRGRGATLTLPHPLVSREHCEIYEDAGRLMVRDLGSLNGTFVNNQRVTDSLLPAGDLLTIGTVTFRAVYEARVDLSPPVVNDATHPADHDPTLREQIDDLETLEVLEEQVVEEDSVQAIDDSVLELLMDDQEPENSADDETTPLPPNQNQAADDDDLSSFLKGLQ